VNDATVIGRDTTKPVKMVDQIYSAFEILEYPRSEAMSIALSGICWLDGYSSTKRPLDTQPLFYTQNSRLSEQSGRMHIVGFIVLFLFLEAESNGELDKNIGSL